MLLSYFLLLTVHATFIRANTEKIIFTAPEAIKIPTAHPTIEDLNLEVLTPPRNVLQTQLRAEFPTESRKHGVPSWFLIDNMQQGQRYEARVCWAAIQPTAFRLEVFDLQTVFGQPDLVTSLAEYSATRQSTRQSGEPRTSPDAPNPATLEKTSSMLLLQILSAAEYYTMNQTLMKRVPPVHVDIILDPYLFNVVPRSLVPTAIYIIIVAVGAWALSRQVRLWLLELQIQDVKDEKKKL
jgi:hypothetical protein